MLSTVNNNSLNHVSLFFVQFNRSVNKLLLDGCKVGGAGGIQVASMLQVNQNITHLGLANTDLNTDCIIAMATILHGNKFLR